MTRICISAPVAQMYNYTLLYQLYVTVSTLAAITDLTLLTYTNYLKYREFNCNIGKSFPAPSILMDYFT